jgi:hypothetical protein
MSDEATGARNSGREDVDETVDVVDASDDIAGGAELVGLARAIGRQLRHPITEAERRAHLARLAAANAERLMSGAVGVAAGTGGSAQPGDGRPAGRPSREGRRRSSLRGLRRVGSLGAVAIAGLAVVAGVVMTRVGDDLPLIVLAGGPGMEAAAPMAGRGGLDISQDAAMLPWNPVVFEFELADGVRLDAGRAAAWRIAPPADLAGSAASLAALLGLPAPQPSEWGDGSLAVTGSDNAHLWVGVGGDWYYGGPYDPTIWDCVWPDTEPAAAPGAEVAPEARDAEGGDASRDLPLCVEQLPPSGVPDATAARTLATAFFARVGLGRATISDVYADEWSASVSGWIDVTGDADDARLWVGVGFGGDGVVAWANGTLGTPVRLGEYPTVTSDEALERLRGMFTLSAATPRPYEPTPADPAPDAPTSDPATSGPATSGPATSEPTSPSPDEPVTGRGDDVVTILPVPGPSDPDVEPEVVRVLLVSVRLVREFAWTADGGMLLVPHYRFTDSGGGVWTVPAVTDRYLVS